MRPLPLEDNMEQYKDSWAELEAGRLKTLVLGLVLAGLWCWVTCLF